MDAAPGDGPDAPGLSRSAGRARPAYVRARTGRERAQSDDPQARRHCKLIAGLELARAGEIDASQPADFTSVTISPTEIRRALLGAVDQAEAMTAVAGTDRANWIDDVGMFPTETPLANDAGIGVLHAPRDYGAVQRALARAGYQGEPIVVIAPADLPAMQALSVVGADQLRRAGMNVDLQEVDAGTALRRRLSQQPTDKGGWNAFFYLLDRSTPTTNPFGNPAIRADGRAAWDGWPGSPRIEALRANWLDASSLDDEKRISRELQMQLWRDVPYIPMGEFWQATAYRKELAGVLAGCFPVFWGVRRA